MAASFRESINFTAASLPPTTPKEITPKEPFGRYFLANSCWLSFSRPEKEWNLNHASGWWSFSQYKPPSHSKGLQKIGVGKVLSTINGTPCLCAVLANLLVSLVFEGCGLHNGNHSGFSLFRLIASLHTDGIDVVICHSYYSFHLFRLL